jgi:hypothetical protein
VTLLTVAIGGFVASSHYGDRMSADMVGYWIGLLVIPFVVAFAASRISKTKRWTVFAWTFLLNVLLFSGACPRDYRTAEQQVGDLLKEESGTKVRDTTKDSREMTLLRPLLHLIYA